MNNPLKVPPPLIILTSAAAAARARAAVCPRELPRILPSTHHSHLTCSMIDQYLSDDGEVIKNNVLFWF
jgi:hypothetical protein